MKPGGSRKKPHTPRSVTEAGSNINAKKRTVKRRSSQTQDFEEGTQVEHRVAKAEPTRVTRRRRATINDKTEDEPQVIKASLKPFAQATIAKTIEGLVTEFAELKAATSAPPVKTAFDANPDKNRYKDVFCGDESRVVLTWPPGSTNDYIHANYVTVRGQKRFICTQGPTEKTVDDFWRMIFEHKCRAIVMLCNVIEMGKKKCELYYPDKLDETMTTPSNVIIKNVKISEADVLTITNLDVSCDGETMHIKHYLWNSWPDRGVPSNIMACLRLLHQLKVYCPAVVHCSAGIGRTGTIVALEMAQDVVNHGEPLSMLNIVKELRSFRAGSVQTDIQYVYMHRVMMGLAEKQKVLKPEEFQSFFNDYDAFLKSRGC